jgi:hypothetical protein
MSIKWWNIFAFEVLSIIAIIGALGYLKLPKFLRRKQLAKGFPWGYYPDAVPKADPGFYAENNTDFLHDVGTEFAGMEGFGDFGEFSGFGEMGEFGAHFGAGGHMGGGE